MRKIEQSLPQITVNPGKITDSPIESMFLNECLRRNSFVLVTNGLEPCGEGNFIFPQCSVGRYRADFIIRSIGYPIRGRVWPPRLFNNICVECDGQEFHTSDEQKEYDRNRDEYFLENGIKTIRFSGYEINSNVSLCVDRLEHEIQMGMRTND